MKERTIKYPEFVDTSNITVENYGYDSNNFRFVLKVPFKTIGNNFLRVIMKNPSKANEEKCDMTMIKACKAAHKASYDGIIVMNMFPYRATIATDLYKNYYNTNNDLYIRSMKTNIDVLEKNCFDADVVFAWGTNTIHQTKSFDTVYNEIANTIKDCVLKCSRREIKAGEKNLHALRWSENILIENNNINEVNSKNTRLVIHHNMFGASCEVAGLNNEDDFKIYCYKNHKICVPKCNNCPFFGGDEMGKGISCIWEDPFIDITTDEHIVQHDEIYMEFERVENHDFYLDMIKIIQDDDFDLCKSLLNLD